MNSFWREQESRVLLEAWEEVHSKYGRRIPSEEWDKITSKVEESRPGITKKQCQDRVDNLKKRYKKEKEKQAQKEWPYFRKLDSILSPGDGRNANGSMVVESNRNDWLDLKLGL